jgi:hypothetical protein
MVIVAMLFSFATRMLLYVSDLRVNYWSDTVNRVPFPYSVSKVIVPL